jgi:hypothetical protein
MPNHTFLTLKTVLRGCGTAHLLTLARRRSYHGSPVRPPAGDTDMPQHFAPTRLFATSGDGTAAPMCGPGAHGVGPYRTTPYLYKRWARVRQRRGAANTHNQTTSRDAGDERPSARSAFARGPAGGPKPNARQRIDVEHDRRGMELKIEEHIPWLPSVGGHVMPPTFQPAIRPAPTPVPGAPKRSPPSPASALTNTRRLQTRHGA